MKNLLEVGEIIVADLPWKNSVDLVVLNVEAIEVEHCKHRTENYVLLYGDNCLVKCVYYGYFSWKKDAQGEPYSEWTFSGLEDMTLIAEEVHIAALDTKIALSYL